MFDVFNPMAFQIHGGGDGHGGVAELVGNFLAFIESLLSMPAAEIFPTVLPGIARMGNLHPLFVHFPLVLLLAFFVLDLVGSLAHKDSWRNVAGWLLYVGTATIAVAVATGLYAAATVPHDDSVHDIMEHHEQFGFGVLALGGALCIWRWFGQRFLQGGINVLYLGTATIMVICMTFGADLGGLMVYHYGVNVRMVAATPESILEHSHTSSLEMTSEDIQVNPQEAPVTTQADTKAVSQEHEHVHSHDHHHDHPHVHSH